MSHYDRIFLKAYNQERKKEAIRKEKRKIHSIKLKAKEMARSGKAKYYIGKFSKTMARGAKRTSKGLAKFNKADKKYKGKKNQALGGLQNMTEAFFR